MNDSIRPLGCFGLHADRDGIAYLFQGNMPEGWNFFGIQKKSGMTAKHLGGKCTHQVNPYLASREPARKHMDLFEGLVNDPLVSAMLPIPSNKTFYLDERTLPNTSEWLSCLERLCSPLHTNVRPFWSLNRKAIVDTLASSNIHPLVLTGCDADQAIEMRRLSDLRKTMPRTLVMTGSSDMIVSKDVVRIKTNLPNLIELKDLISLPLEHIGTCFIARYCRGQPLFEHSDVA